LTRLFNAKGITDSPEDFFNPTFPRYWQSEVLLNDIDKALSRIQTAVANNEKIMIFGDYDVDGVSSSYIMYTFFKKFLHYDNISIRLPHRLHDGYGIKSYHLDEIHAKGVSLVITVDNGITAVQEALHAKTLGIDFIITDHHRQLETVPE
jgi:single-stranded-DNA-specific exonuclease